MPTYCYKCKKHGEFEETHSIKEQLTECPKCREEGEAVPVQRLISKTSFILANGGSGWAKKKYSG